MFDVKRATRGWRDDLAAQRTLSRDELSELEDHLLAVYESLLDCGLTAPDAWAAAREAVGVPEELAEEYRKVRTGTWRRLVHAGWALFALSFALPVYEWSLGLFGNGVTESIIGLQAFLFSLQGDVGPFGVGSALTNAAVLATAWRLRDRGRGAVAALAGSMVAAVSLNAWWLLLMDPGDSLLAGYYAWWASFGVIGSGLALRFKELAQRARLAIAG